MLEVSKLCNYNEHVLTTKSHGCPTSIIYSFRDKNPRRLKTLTVTTPPPPPQKPKTTQI